MCGEIVVRVFDLVYVCVCVVVGFFPRTRDVSETEDGEG